MASAAIKCSPCEHSHRPCSWVAAYRRWRVQQMWGVDEATVVRLETAATAAGLMSPRKANKATSQPSGDEAGPSGAAVVTTSPQRTITRPRFFVRDEEDEPSSVRAKRKSRPEEVRVVLKLPRRSTTTTATTTTTTTMPTGTDSSAPASTPRGAADEGKQAADLSELAALREEASRLQRELEASERRADSFRQKILEWEAHSQSLRERRRADEERTSRLAAQAADQHEELVRLRRALAVATEQGHRGDLEGRVVRLERRIERKCSLSLAFDLY